MQLMRQAGATAVVADLVPAGVNAQGWRRLHTILDTPSGHNGIFVRFLEPAIPPSSSPQSE